MSGLYDERGVQLKVEQALTVALEALAREFDAWDGDDAEVPIVTAGRWAAEQTRARIPKSRLDTHPNP